MSTATAAALTGNEFVILGLFNSTHASLNDVANVFIDSVKYRFNAAGTDGITDGAGRVWFHISLPFSTPHTEVHFGVYHTVTGGLQVEGGGGADQGRMVALTTTGGYLPLPSAVTYLYRSSVVVYPEVIANAIDGAFNYH